MNTINIGKATPNPNINSTGTANIVLNPVENIENNKLSITPATQGLFKIVNTNPRINEENDERSKDNLEKNFFSLSGVSNNLLFSLKLSIIYQDPSPKRGIPINNFINRLEKNPTANCTK